MTNDTRLSHSPSAALVLAALFATAASSTASAEPDIRGDQRTRTEVAPPAVELPSTEPVTVKIDGDKPEVSAPEAQALPPRPPKRALARAIAAYQAGLGMCGDLSRRGIRASDKVVVQFAVDARGRAQAVTVTGRRALTDVKRCIRLKVSEWILPPGDGTALAFRVTVDAAGRVELVARAPAEKLAAR